MGWRNADLDTCKHTRRFCAAKVVNIPVVSGLFLKTLSFQFSMPYASQKDLLCRRWLRLPHRREGQAAYIGMPGVADRYLHLAVESAHIFLDRVISF